jgi:hypothetical protein
MTNSRSQELSEKAAAERRRCRDWLILIHAERLAEVFDKGRTACRCLDQLNVSKSSFDFAWIDAIEKTGRHDWYEHLRRPPRTKT